MFVVDQFKVDILNSLIISFRILDLYQVINCSTKENLNIWYIVLVKTFLNHYLQEEMIRYCHRCFYESWQFMFKATFFTEKLLIRQEKQLCILLLDYSILSRSCCLNKEFHQNSTFYSDM